MRATVWVEDGYIWARVAWNANKSPQLNSRLKTRLPPGTRRWNPDKKAWQFDPAYDTELMEVLEEYCTEVHVLETEKEIVEVPIPMGQDAFSQLFRLAPDALLRKFHRELVIAFHPDRIGGGDNEKMITINSAWEKIRKERGL